VAIIFKVSVVKKIRMSIIKRLNKMVWSLAPRIPFLSLNTVLRKLDGGARSVLDIGCGTGEPMKFIKRQRYYLRIGADIYAPSLKQAQQQGIYDMQVLCDLRKLPFKSKAVDIVLCLQTLEHFEREDGLRLIEEMERIARIQVIITTRVCDWKATPSEANPYDEHKYTWKPRELKNLGYTVRGYGFRGFGGSTGLNGHIPRAALPFAYLAWVLAGPFSYYVPAIAGGVVCNKKII
jgi:ubiquinone/menaquinone biosynthesis C-methylase UbiE